MNKIRSHVYIELAITHNMALQVLFTTSRSRGYIQTAEVQESDGIIHCSHGYI